MGTDDQWMDNLSLINAYQIPHLSAYALTVEDKTLLSQDIKRNKVAPLKDDHTIRQMDMLLDWVVPNQFEAYEISNFAKPGHYSRHNTSYWNGEPYLGIGPSAHSYNKVSRQWNISNNPQYIRSIDESIVPFEREELTDTEKFNEYILTSLRTIWGISLRKLFLEFGEISAMEFQRNIIPLLDDEQIELQGENLVLTRRGKFFADRIAADLFQ